MPLTETQRELLESVEEAKGDLEERVSKLTVLTRRMREWDSGNTGPLVAPEPTYAAVNCILQARHSECRSAIISVAQAMPTLGG